MSDEMNYEYEQLNEEPLHEGFLKIKRHRVQHASFHGGQCEPIVRERLEDLAAVSVLLYDPDRDEVVLVEQFRVGLMGQVEPPWTLETVSGFCDKAHEIPAEVARREVHEETGCTLSALTRIGSFFVSPGISDEQIHLFCGRVDATGAAGVHGLAEEGEEMRVVVMPREEAASELFGRLGSTSIVIAMQWLEANRHRLVDHWA